VEITEKDPFKWLMDQLKFKSIKKLANEKNLTVDALTKRKDRDPLIICRRITEEKTGIEKFEIASESCYTKSRTQTMLNKNIPVDCCPLFHLANLGECYRVSQGKVLLLRKTLSTWDNQPIFLKTTKYRECIDGIVECRRYVDLENILRLVKYEESQGFFSKKKRKERSFPIMPRHYKYRFELKKDFTPSMVVQYIRACREVMPHSTINMKYKGFVYTHNALHDLIHDEIPAGAKIQCAVFSQRPAVTFHNFRLLQENDFDLKIFFGGD